MTTIDPRSSPLPACKPSGWKWLKALPKHWEARKLKHCLGVNESTLPETTDPDLEFRYIEIGAVNSGDLVEPPAIIRFSAAPSRARRIVKGGDTIVSTVRTYLKAVWYAEDPGDNLICSTGFAVLTPKQGTVPKFASYVAQSAPFTDQVTAESVGIAYPAIGEKKLGDLRIGLPPPEEQTAIVRYLDNADQQIQDYIDAKQKLIALLEEERQGVINQAVTRGLDPHVRLKPSGLEWLGDVPEHWEIRRSKRLFTPRGELARQNDIQLSATQAYGVIPQEEYERRVGRKIVRISLHLEKRQHVEVDDFVISMRSFEGGLERAWATGCIRSSYIVLRPTTEVEVEFFAYVFKSQPYIRALQLTANFIRDGQDLNFNNFRAVDLPCPPTEEQRRTAGALRETITKIDTTIIRTRRQIELINEYRTRLIADVVTGKIDVRKAAEELPELEPTEITN